MLCSYPIVYHSCKFMICRGISFNVGNQYIGTRIDKFIRDKYPRVPFSLIQRELRKRKIYSECKTKEQAIVKTRYKPGDHFSSSCTLYLPDFFSKVDQDYKDNVITSSKPVLSLKPSIIYEDSHLLVLNKPSSICTQPTPDSSYSIQSILQASYPSSLFYPVHRLDRDTTGVLLLTKDRETARLISHEFACGFVKKTYLVAGLNTTFASKHIPPCGLIQSDMMKTDDYTGRLYRAIHGTITSLPNGLFPSRVSSSVDMNAITGYKILHNQDAIVTLMCRLYTGKTHQIRVHLKDMLGLEVLNDKKYGNRKLMNSITIPIDKKALYLHCYKMNVQYGNNAMENTLQQIPSGHREFISDTAFDFYGKRMVSASADGYLRIWNLSNDEWKMQTEIKAHSSLISRVDWAHPIFGQIFAACLHNDTVAIYQEIIGEDKKKTWSKRCTIATPSSSPTDISFCPSCFGLRIAICCKDGSVYIYKPVDTYQIWTWQCDSFFQVNKQVNCLSWCKCRNLPMSLVIGTDDDAQIWVYPDSHQWTPSYVLRENNGIIRNVAWSSNIGKDYETIATACSDGCIRIFEIRPTGCSLSACLRDHGRDVWRIEWNITGTILASSGDDNCVRMWKQKFDGDWCCISEIHPDK